MNDFPLNSDFADGRERPYIAVATQEGLFVNQHLGRTETFRLYPFQEARPRLMGLRPAPEADLEARWKVMAERLKDCVGIVASGAGEGAIRALAELGLKVWVASGDIAEIVGAIRAGTLEPAQSGNGPSGCGGLR
jgi:nitrogen fixation protein NifB